MTEQSNSPYEDLLLIRTAVLRHKIKRQDAEIKLLREELSLAQGEAYLGLLDGVSSPTPMEACRNVVNVCKAALEGKP